MKNMLKVFAFVSILAVLMAGCGVAPVYNVVDYPTELKKEVKEDSIYKAIKQAAMGLGWEVRKVKPGLAQATLYLRTHVAVVNIPYSEKSFSIKYVSSSNLNYDSGKGTIHTNYNGWIQNLRNAIALRMSSLVD